MKNKALFSLILSMAIFGTVGIFRRFIPIPSGMLAFSRGIIGAAFIFIFLWVIKKPLDFKKIKKSLLPLCLSGAMIGFNWMLLFESYNYTSVAAATLCYYMAPVIVIACSPFLFKEKLGAKKLLCVAAAFLGMVLVSGVFETGIAQGETKGVLLALGAAVLYASVVMTNKKLGETPPFERTTIQLLSASVAILPYSVLKEQAPFADVTSAAVIMLILVGILHTGTAYLLYFSSVGKLSAQTSALFSYVDPVVAIALSALVLKEEIGPKEIIGAVLILGSTLISELLTDIKKDL